MSQAPKRVGGVPTYATLFEMLERGDFASVYGPTSVAVAAAADASTSDPVASPTDAAAETIVAAVTTETAQ